MKKFTTSAAFILVFTLYALGRHLTAAAPVTVATTPTQSVVATTTVPTGRYRDGTYTSPSVDAYYGNVQIVVTVSGGKVSSVRFIDYPQGRSTSDYINAQATPILISEAIQNQSAPVNAVSGATYTSQAFNQSLSSVLTQASA